MPNDSHYLEPPIVRLAKSLANWTLSRPRLSREPLIDDHDGTGSRVIMHGERPASSEGDPERLEIPWRHWTEIDIDDRWLSGNVFDLDRPELVIPAACTPGRERTASSNRVSNAATG